MKKFFIILAVLGVWFLGPVSVGAAGKCYCERPDNSGGIYEDYFSTQDDCSGRAIRSLGEDEACTNNDRFTDCQRADNVCFCRDKKSILPTCKWQIDFCCCKKTDSGYSCSQSSNYLKGSPVCNEKVLDYTDYSSGVCVCEQQKSGQIENNPVIGCMCDKVGDKLRQSLPLDETDCKLTNLRGKYGDAVKGDVVENCYWGPILKDLPNFSESECKGIISTDKDYSNCRWQLAQGVGGQTIQTGYATFSLQQDGTCDGIGNYTGLKSDITQLQKDAAVLNQIKFKTPQEFIGQAIKVLLSFIGSIALILYIYAGVNWMLDRGSGERVKNSKNIIVWTTLSVFMMLASYILVQYIFKIF